MNPSLFIAIVALTVSTSEQKKHVPFSLPYMTYYGISLLFKGFLIVSSYLLVEQSVELTAILVAHCILYRVWNQLLRSGSTMLAMIQMAIIAGLSIVYVVVSIGKGIVGLFFFVPYFGWCIALLIWNIQLKEAPQPELPIMSTPPKMAKFPKTRNEIRLSIK